MDGGDRKDDDEDHNGDVGDNPAVRGMGERWMAPRREGGGEEDSFIQKFYYRITKVIIIWIAIPSFGTGLPDNPYYQSKKHTKCNNLMELL